MQIGGEQPWVLSVHANMILAEKATQHLIYFQRVEGSPVQNLTALIMSPANWAQEDGQCHCIPFHFVGHPSCLWQSLAVHGRKAAAKEAIEGNSTALVLRTYDGGKRRPAGWNIIPSSCGE